MRQMHNQGEGSTRERRANIRLHRVLTIELEFEGEFHSTVAVDLSVSGFQVAANFAPPIGEKLPLKLYLRSGPVLEGLAELVWSEKLEMGLFRLGFQFEEMKGRDFERLCKYVDGERLNSEGLAKEPQATLELATQVTLRSITASEFDRFSVLAKISELLNSCSRLDEVLDRALKITVEATGAERGMVLLDRGGTDFDVPAFHTMTSDRNLGYSRSVVNKVLQTGLPLLSLDAQSDERLDRSSSLKVMGTRSVLCLSIGAGDRHYGMIYLDSSVRSGAFTEIDLRLATVIASMAASAIERAENFAQLAQSEKLASMGTLMAGVMHELRNPLSSILGISELLAQDSEDELTQDLLEEARRCQRLVHDLLRLSRKEPAEFVALDLLSVTESAAIAVRSELKRKEIAFHLEAEEALPQVFGNADHLRQVVLNLLTNALYAASGKPDGEVKVKLRSQGRFLQLSVSDNGCGLPPGAEGRLFDPFYTTKSGTGTGLGLSIVHRIVTEHQGTITAENRSRGGSLFLVTLPVHVREKEESQAV